MPLDTIPTETVARDSLMFSGHGNLLVKARPRPMRHILGTPYYPHALDTKRLNHKAFWRASAQVVGMNLSLWAFDRYVVKGEYAKISWHSIAENFKHGFEWDDDHLGTNMFAHPYNGSLFYNAGRSNGFNFWQSELFAIGGSAMWEMFMEKEYPSTNDIIATPIGGAAIGEVLYRTSDFVFNDRLTGWTRFGHEVAGFLIDPMRGMTRILTGRAWKVRPYSGRRFGLPPISIDFSLGGRVLTFHDGMNIVKAGPAARINVIYGDKFSEASEAPYDYFTFLMELQAVSTQPFLNRLEIQGRLLSRRIMDKKGSEMTLGLFQHFDFFDSDTIVNKNVPIEELNSCTVPYKLGTPASLGGGLMYRFTLPRKFTVDADLHANAVILAGTLSDFYRRYHRNYDWASGFSIKAYLRLALANDAFDVSFSNQLYRLYTWAGYRGDQEWSLAPGGTPIDADGDRSRALFNHLEARVNYRLWKNLYATLGMDFYSRRTHYLQVRQPKGRAYNTLANNPTIWSRQMGLYFMLTYKL